jgi:dipeptide/tripeptide permease
LDSVFAALSVGLLAQAFGYHSVFVACAILAGAGLVMVCLCRPRRNDLPHAAGPIGAGAAGR